MSQLCRLAAVFVLVFLSNPLIAGRRSNSHEFAHIGDGVGIRTTFLVNNESREEINGNICFFKTDGSRLSLRINGESRSCIVFAIPVNGSLRFETAGDSEPVQVGWARLLSSGPVGAQALFEIEDDGHLLTQAAVDSSDSVRSSVIFVDQSADSNTGVAIANVSQFKTIRVVLTLRDQAGMTVASTALNLPPLGKEARFIFELFEQMGSIRGSLTIQASGRFAAIALQQTGLVLGTIPPIS